MTAIRLTSVAVAYPPYWVRQEDTAQRIGQATGDPRRVAAIARGTQIDKRAVALPPDEIARLGNIEERNRIYQHIAPSLAIAAARGALGGRCVDSRLSAVVAASCTGYMVPGWDVQLANTPWDEPVALNSREVLVLIRPPRHAESGAITIHVACESTRASAAVEFELEASPHGAKCYSC